MPEKTLTETYQIRRQLDQKYVNRIADPILAAEVDRRITQLISENPTLGFDDLDALYQETLLAVEVQGTLIGSAGSAGQIENPPEGGFNMGDDPESTRRVVAAADPQNAVEIEQSLSTARGLNMEDPTQFRIMILNNKLAGLESYRFSVAWKKIINSDGSVNQQELDRYRQQVEICRELNVEPLVVLHHFDLPDGFEWTDDDARRRFNEFAEVVLTELIPAGAKFWIAVNEPNVELGSRYLMGAWSPNLVGAVSKFFKARENMAECIKDFYMRAKQIAAESNQEVTVLTSINLSNFDAGSDEVLLGGVTRKFAEWWDHLMQLKMHEENGVQYYDAIGLQYYWTHDIAIVGKLKEALLSKVKSFIAQAAKGVNALDAMYSMEEMNTIVAEADAIDQSVAPPVEETQRYGTHGQILNPAGIYDVIMAMHQRRPNVPIAITEWGSDIPATRLEDKVWYISETLKSLKQAQADGVTLVGNWMWTLIRNWEIIGPFGGGWGGDTGYNFGMAGDIDLETYPGAGLPVPFIFYPNMIDEIVKQGKDAGFIKSENVLSYHEYIDHTVEAYLKHPEFITNPQVKQLLKQQLENVKAYLQQSNNSDREFVIKAIEQRLADLDESQAADAAA